MSYKRMLYSIIWVVAVGAKFVFANDHVFEFTYSLNGTNYTGFISKTTSYDKESGVDVIVDKFEFQWSEQSVKHVSEKLFPILIPRSIRVFRAFNQENSVMRLSVRYGEYKNIKRTSKRADCFLVESALYLLLAMQELPCTEDIVVNEYGRFSRTCLDFSDCSVDILWDGKKIVSAMSQYSKMMAGFTAQKYKTIWRSVSVGGVGNEVAYIPYSWSRFEDYCRITRNRVLTNGKHLPAEIVYVSHRKFGFPDIIPGLFPVIKIQEIAQEASGSEYQEKVNGKSLD